MSSSKECQTEHDCLLAAFEALGLCHHCWQMFLDCENKPELANKLHKWFHGDYVDNQAAAKRLEAKLKRSPIPPTPKGAGILGVF